MNPKQVITTNQLYIIFYISIVTTGILSLPYPMYLIAQQNMWIALLFSSVMGFLIISICSYFQKHFSGKNIIQIIDNILGKKMGYLVIVILFVTYSFQFIYILKEYELYLTDLFYQFMSPSLIIGLMLLVSIYSTSAGVEVIARCAQIILPSTVILSIGIFLLLLPDIQFHNILPIFEKGLVPPIKGSFVAMAWLSELNWTTFYFHTVTESAKRVRRLGYLYVAAIISSLLLFFILILGVLGPYTAHSLYPASLAERYIRIGSFIERTSAFFMSIWILGIFIKVTSLLFILTQCAQALTHIASTSLITSSIAVIYFFLSLFLFTSTSSLFQTAYPLFLKTAFSTNFGLLTLIFFIGFLKKKIKPFNKSN
ncbi:GerAB/ArcD/ProY family transporter [Sporolactobacillus sp. STCC-11]|uniref:GerAB/ArcD/ProY family transporter n=1 Tax=Sporolactobacillus caesalpiniae TaxID=3230362 RepID=UPI0033915FFF